jgi:hypothetical protein
LCDAARSQISPNQPLEPTRDSIHPALRSRQAAQRIMQHHRVQDVAVRAVDRGGDHLGWHKPK